MLYDFMILYTFIILANKKNMDHHIFCLIGGVWEQFSPTADADIYECKICGKKSENVKRQQNRPEDSHGTSRQIRTAARQRKVESVADREHGDRPKYASQSV